MLSKFVRIVLWVFIHILYTILENILVLWVYINLKIKEMGRLKCSKSSAEFVSENISGVLKKPQHLVLILDEENILYEDLARMIIWSLAAGISYFSFYDKTGKPISLINLKTLIKIVFKSSLLQVTSFVIILDSFYIVVVFRNIFLS